MLAAVTHSSSKKTTRQFQALINNPGFIVDLALLMKTHYPYFTYNQVKSVYYHASKLVAPGSKQYKKFSSLLKDFSSMPRPSPVEDRESSQVLITQDCYDVLKDNPNDDEAFSQLHYLLNRAIVRAVNNQNIPIESILQKSLSEYAKANHIVMGNSSGTLVDVQQLFKNALSVDEPALRDQIHYDLAILELYGIERSGYIPGPENYLLAGQYLQEVTTKDPILHAEALTVLGMLLGNKSLELEDTEQDPLRSQIECYQEALPHDPNNIQALYNLALFEKCNGDTDKAHAKFAKVLKLAPEHEQATVQMAELEFASFITNPHILNSLALMMTMAKNFSRVTIQCIFQQALNMAEPASELYVTITQNLKRYKLENQPRPASASLHNAATPFATAAAGPSNYKDAQAEVAEPLPL